MIWLSISYETSILGLRSPNVSCTPDVEDIECSICTWPDMTWQSFSYETSILGLRSPTLDIIPLLGLFSFSFTRNSVSPNPIRAIKNTDPRVIISGRGVTPTPRVQNQSRSKQCGGSISGIMVGL